LRLQEELAEASSNPETLLSDALHSTGYSGALANPLIASGSSIGRLNTDVLEYFIAVRFISISVYSSPLLQVAFVDMFSLLFLACVSGELHCSQNCSSSIRC
jgi:hypothetical protein